MRHSPLISGRKMLLTSLIASSAILLVTISTARAAPAVSGQNGCILKSDGAVINTAPQSGASVGDEIQYQRCDPQAYNSFYDSSQLTFGNFVTADEVNNAFVQLQNEYQTYVNQQVANSGDDGKDAEQDARLDGHDQSITNINNTITNQQVQLDDHSTRIDAVEQKNVEQDTRLDGHDQDIASIRDTAVFYNTDADGNKTGGVTLNDGTGNPVQLGNVAAGRAQTDAVNVSQLSSTVAALGGDAKINADGTIQAPLYEVAGLSYNNVGDALVATNEAAVQYVTDGNGHRTNDVVLTGDGTGPVRIHNVADGKADTDAVNVRQVKQAAQESKNYTDYRFSELQASNDTQFSALGSQIERNLQETRGGIASAMGMAALRFDNTPGKLSVASGVGSFKGSTSTVAGIGYTSEDGFMRINASMGYNFGENDLSWNAGASFTLN